MCICIYVILQQRMEETRRNTCRIFNGDPTKYYKWKNFELIPALRAEGLYRVTAPLTVDGMTNVYAERSFILPPPIPHEVIITMDMRILESYLRERERMAHNREIEILSEKAFGKLERAVHVNLIAILRQNNKLCSSRIALQNLDHHFLAIGSTLTDK